jgi:hypothetical protein
VGCALWTGIGGGAPGGGACGKAVTASQPARNTDKGLDAMTFLPII